MESLNNDDIAYCRRRIADEEASARDAGSPEAGELHAQIAILYKVQLQVLTATRLRP